MIRMMLGLLALFAIIAVAVGFAAHWQMPGLLNVVDRLTPGLAGTRVAHGIAYGSADIQRVDVYAPERGISPVTQPANRPVIVFFHGGGWHSGGRDVYGFAGRAFAAEGFVTVVVGYRLGADGKFPIFMQDAAAAIRWTHANIARHGGDPTRIVLAGHSAGAHIALLSALDPHWLEDVGLGAMTRPGGAIRGVIGLAGPADFLPFETGGSAEAAMGHVRPLENTQPIHFARGDAPPLMLAHGDADTTVRLRNSRNLAAAIHDAGGQAQLRVYPGADHAGTVKPLSLVYRNDSSLLADAVAFSKAVTAAPTPQAPDRPQP
ncbi:MAG: alpha/beta hydrolase [Sphingopyxis sp.]